MSKKPSKKSTTKIKPTGAFALFGQSYDLVRRNLSSFVILNLLPAAILLGTIISRNRSANTNNLGNDSGLPVYLNNRFGGFGVIITLAVIIAIFIVSTMLFCLELQAAKGKTPDLSSLWDYVSKFWLRLVGLSLLVSLYVIGGFILLIIPGIIMIRRYFLAPYVLIDQDTTVTEAMRRSAEMSKPYSRSIWRIIGVAVLLGIPSLINDIGSFISLILAVAYSVAPAIRYLELKKLTKTTKYAWKTS